MRERERERERNQIWVLWIPFHWIRSSDGKTDNYEEYM